MKPWICPRCSMVNAPWVSQCNCVPDVNPPYVEPVLLPYTQPFYPYPYRVGDPPYPAKVISSGTNSYDHQTTTTTEVSS